LTEKAYGIIGGMHMRLFATAILVAGLCHAACAAAPPAFTKMWKGEELWKFGGGRYKGNPDPVQWRSMPGALVHRFSVLFKAALTPDPAAIYGTPQETALEDSLGASRCPLRRHRPKFPYWWRWPAWSPPPPGRGILYPTATTTCPRHTTRKGDNSLRRPVETVYTIARSVDYQIVDTDSAKTASQAV
jgi:hypothetical protein